MKFLVIQTSFIGDVIAATAVIEKLHQHFPDAKIDMMVRKGNEQLLTAHPFLNRILVWEKKKNKISNLFKLIGEVRKEKYDTIINLHRFFSTGLITAFSDSSDARGFKKNPFSFLFKKSFPHHLGNGITEYQRNQLLITDLTDNKPAKPRLYPSIADYEFVENKKQETRNGKTYLCIAPASIWFTKQLPVDKWIELIERTPYNYSIYLLGASEDFDYAEEIKEKANHTNVINLSGKLTLLQSAALMEKAKMNYVNDSAPMHICSAMNAPVTVFYLSTIPAFGFVPVSDNSTIIETKENLDCRPCGIHGYMQCPKGHFRCALTIDMKDIAVPNE
jgi:ADP-heptose:LPS heptosyltransferase